MAFRRRRRTRRRARATRLRLGRAPYNKEFSMRVRRLALKPHFFKRTVSLTATNIQSAVAGGVGAALSNTADSWVLNTGTTANVSYFSVGVMYTLATLPDASDFTGLFDQYKINRVKLRLIPYSCNTVLQTGIGTANNQGLAVILHRVPDYDDNVPFAASVTGLNEMRQYPQYRSRNFFDSRGRAHKMYLRPHIAQAAYGAGVFTSYANRGPMFIDAASPAVEHYGHKWIMEVFQPDTTVPCFIWFKMEATLYLECRNPR